MYSLGVRKGFVLEVLDNFRFRGLGCSREVLTVVFIRVKFFYFFGFCRLVILVGVFASLYLWFGLVGDDLVVVVGEGF